MSVPWEDAVRWLGRGAKAGKSSQQQTATTTTQRSATTTTQLTLSRARDRQGAHRGADVALRSVQSGRALVAGGADGALRGEKRGGVHVLCVPWSLDSQQQLGSRSAWSLTRMLENPPTIPDTTQNIRP